MIYYSHSTPTNAQRLNPMKQQWFKYKTFIFWYLQLAGLSFEMVFSDKEEGGEHRGTNPNEHLHELPFYGDASHLINKS